MKISVLILAVVLLNKEVVQAQPGKEPATKLTKEQHWLFEKTKQFMTSKGENASTKLFLENYKKLLAANINCKIDNSPEKSISLEGSRIDEANTLLQWAVTGETETTRYIVERRYLNPDGKFDSIGVIDGRGATASQDYRFSDQNDFPGITWYRLRGINWQEDIQKLVKIEGYNNVVKVFPNPVTSSNIRLELIRFKTNGNTALVIRDSKGSIVYARQQIFLDNNKACQLQNLKLPKGAYYLQVSNKYNTGATAFVIQ